MVCSTSKSTKMRQEFLNTKISLAYVVDYFYQQINGKNPTFPLKQTDLVLDGQTQDTPDSFSNPTRKIPNPS